MKSTKPVTDLKLWRNERLFNIDFASYSLQNHHFPRHFHNHYVIELVVKGADHFFCNWENYTATANQLILINPGEVHTGSTGNDNNLQYYSLYPCRKTLKDVASVTGICLQNDFNFQKPVANQSLLTEKLLLLFKSFTNSCSPLFQEELFYDCLYTLLNHSTCRPESPGISMIDNRIAIVTDFIRQHFREEISLQQLASVININPFSLIRLFKKNIGISPYEYLLVVRTEYAKELLQQGHKVQWAAQKAGFYDTSHFSRSFRKFAGTSPKSFLSSKGQHCTIFA